ncbi:MAG: hypothetical protein D3924_12860, partial [Candidatus Electrothrix sp. AR4]|nr:hypothetical protein [Candidatus Electrothrix sp. AR4]
AADSFTSPSGIGAFDDLQCRHKFTPPSTKKSTLSRPMKLLRLAYPDEKKIPEIYISGSSSDADTVIPLLQDMLKRNLGLSIQKKTWSDSDPSPHLFVASKTAALPHVHYFLSEFYSSENRLKWNNQKHDEFKALLINALSHPSGSAQQNNLYQQAEEILCEEVALVPLFFRDVAFLAKPHLQWVPSVTGVQQIRLWSLRN